MNRIFFAGVAAFVVAACASDGPAGLTRYETGITKLNGTTEVCYPTEENNNCEGGGSTGGGDQCGGCTGIVIGGALTSSQCLATPHVDMDFDGIGDLCEFYLANGFKPNFKFDLGDDTLGREPYWAVRRYGQYGYRIFYALGYYRDGGEPTSGFGSHNGDSEFVYLDVTFDDSLERWVLLGMFTSAHAGTPLDNSQYTHFTGLDYYGGHSRGRPHVWVAEEKHANYATQADCNFLDDCDGDVWGSILIYESANMGGSVHQLLDNVNSRYYPSPSGDEQLWSGTYFCGWIGGVCDIPGYGTHLSAAGF